MMFVDHTCTEREKDNPKKALFTPPKINIDLEMMVWKMIFLFQECILRFHVNLPECIL